MSTSLQLLNATVKLDNYNNDFLILKSKDQEAIRKIGKAIFYQDFDFVEEVIVTEVEILLKLNEHFVNSKIDHLKRLKEGEHIKPKTFQLPVYFNDHEDWAFVESSTGLEKEAIVNALIKTDFSIAMFGFLPGFLYLEGLDQSLHIPRKTVPSKYVKANSIAIGGQYLGVYSLDSPGGWQVIGKTPISILQTPELPPLGLSPGDRVVIQAIEKAEYETLLQKKISLIEYNL